MIKMRSSALALALLLGLSGLSRADELTAEKKADIEKLMAVTGASKLGLQMGEMAAGQMLEMLRKSKPDIPDRALEVVRQEVINLMRERMEGPEGLQAQMLPVYSKYFTHADVKAMLDFYATPTGLKTVQLMPAVMQEAMGVGQRWGQALGPELQQRIAAALKREGF